MLCECFVVASLCAGMCFLVCVVCCVCCRGFSVFLVVFAQGIISTDPNIYLRVFSVFVCLAYVLNVYCVCVCCVFRLLCVEVVVYWCVLFLFLL